MSKEAYYFSHDANARHDPKILAMREDYGVKGYGVYWVIVEMLREQDEFKLPLKKYIWSAIAMQVQCKDYAKEDAKQFVEICINEYELFNSDGEYFWSNSLIKRMGKKNEVSEKRRAAAKARWDKPNDTNDLEKNDMQNDANAMQNDAIKGKENKLNKKENKLKKKIQYAEFVSMTLEEYEKLISEHGEANVKEMIKVLDNYKGAKGTTYKSDYRAILNWVIDRVKGQVKPGKGVQSGKNTAAEDWANENGLPF
jgi:hypothetical protein